MSLGFMETIEFLRRIRFTILIVYTYRGTQFPFLICDSSRYIYNIIPNFLRISYSLMKTMRKYKTSL